MERYRSLDGWRGVSIALVMCGHLLPLGPSSWQINATAAASGMVIFFNLSGFLITTMLFKNQNIFHFLVRRLCRIVPLAWLALLVTFLAWKVPLAAYAPNFFFYANWPPMAMTEYASHFWSLNVEVQFYAMVGLIVLVFRKRGLYILPFLCVGVTVFRAFNGIQIDISTYYRLDEILAGAVLALVYNNDIPGLKAFWAKLSPLYFLPLVLLSAHPDGGAFAYLRPYFAMLMIGSTLFSLKRGWVIKILESRFLIYMATVSYALYIFHGILRFSWLGTGDTMVRYLKRPLLFAVTFGLAHFSTFHYERFFMNLGKKAIESSKKKTINRSNPD